MINIIFDNSVGSQDEERVAIREALSFVKLNKSFGNFEC